MMVRFIVALIVLNASLVITAREAVALGANYRGPFEGRVVDADTGEPLQGAVVFVEWYINHAFSRPTFYDTAEILTDKDGRFHVKKKWSWNPWRNLVMDSSIIVVKAGYWHIGSHWSPIIEATEILSSLPPGEREKRSAGCDWALGGSKFILGCLDAKEQGSGAHTPVSEIRLQGEKPVFLLRKLPAGGIEDVDTGGRDIPDHKRRLLLQEIEKSRTRSQGERGSR